MTKENIVVFDMETNGLRRDATEVHCVVQYREDHVGSSRPDGIIKSSKCSLAPNSLGLAKDHFENDSKILIGHNIVSYDIPILKRLLGLNLKPNQKIYDTFLASCLLVPDLPGGHSLENWAKVLGTEDQKIQVEDWSKLTQQMLDRCVSDVKINKVLYEHLKTLEWDDKEAFSKAMSLESKVSEIHARQEDYGVKFDVRKAVDLLQRLDKEVAELTEKILREAPLNVSVPSATKKSLEGLKEMLKLGVDTPLLEDIKNPFKKDGKLTKACEGHHLPNIGGPYVRVEFNPLNLNSDIQLKEFLLGLGWKPTTYNFTVDASGKKVKTSPKLTEDSYGSLPPGLGQDIGRLNIVEHRRNYLLNREDKTKGAIATVRRDDFRVPAKALTCATPTSRYRHMETICNVPKPGTPFGSEIRELFCVPEGDFWMVGTDLEQIEARLMCHFAMVAANASKNPNRIKDAKDFCDLVINGDFHSHNATNWCVSRDTAKGGFYALAYGCAEAKLASTLGKPKKEGARLMGIFWDSNPALKYLIDNLTLALKSKGFIKGLEGRVLKIREPRKALNTLLQGAAAVVFKHWMVAVDEHIKKPYPFLSPAHQIIAYHDEIEWEYIGKEIEANSFGALTEFKAEEVGKTLGILVPIKAKSKVGKNWREVH